MNQFFVPHSSKKKASELIDNDLFEKIERVKPSEFAFITNAGNADTMEGSMDEFMSKPPAKPIDVGAAQIHQLSQAIHTSDLEIRVMLPL